jgi:RNA polymerase sigma factor FliA
MTAHATHKTVSPMGPDLDERNKLMILELPQVYSIAVRILERLPKQIELGDLVNAGVIGLMEAHENFNDRKDTQFNTFASFRIRGAILDSLRKLDWGTRTLRRKGRAIAETTSQLESSLGRTPGREEVAAEMNISLQQLEDSRTQISRLQVMGQHATSTNGPESVDLIAIACSTWDNPFEIYCKSEQKERLIEAISQLSQHQQLILSLYYQEELPMREIAPIVGKTVTRVFQLHSAALSKLKAVLQGKGNSHRIVVKTNKLERRVKNDAKDPPIGRWGHVQPWDSFSVRWAGEGRSA